MDDSDIKWEDTIHSDGSRDCVTPQNPKIGDEIIIRIKVYKNNPIKEIYLRSAPKGEQILQEMSETILNDFYQYYEIKIVIESKIFNYRFYIITENDQFWYNAKGISSYYIFDRYDFQIISDFESPSWAKESIFYQIFPDRFFTGNKKNKTKYYKYNVPGFTPQFREWEDIENLKNIDEYSFLDFYGGDINGIKEKIPYLIDLGVTAVYLNPIFSSLSNHGYDVIDYNEINPIFGSKKDFIELVNELHNNNMKIMLDAVINHTGEAHPWFNRLKLFSEPGAYNSADSKYREYYYFKDEDSENYISWLGHKTLPVLDFDSELVREEIYLGENSVLKFWLKKPYSIDGWRFDVANMLARFNKKKEFYEIWNEIRIETKKINKNIYLLGEHFFDPLILLDGLKLDGIMNYQAFCILVRTWLSGENYYRSTNIQKEDSVLKVESKLTSVDLVHNLQEYLFTIPFQIQLLNFNLLSSHDIPRFLSLVNSDLKRAKIGIVMLFTFIGIPSIYYGDEIGLLGEKDPDCRRPMIWDQNKWNNSILSYYRTLIHLRRNLMVLQMGSIRILDYNEDGLVFSRFNKNSFIVVVLQKTSLVRNWAIPMWKIGILNEEIEELFSKKMFTINEGIFNLTIKDIEAQVFISKN